MRLRLAAVVFVILASMGEADAARHQWRIDHRAVPPPESGRVTATAPAAGTVVALDGWERHDAQPLLDDEEVAAFERGRWLYSLLFFAVVGLGFVVLVMLGMLAFRKENRRRRSAAALLRSTPGVHLVPSPASKGSWRWDLTTGMSTRDPVLSLMFGLDAEEATEPLDALFARMAPEDVAPTRDELARAVRERDGFSIAYRVALPDGAVRWLRGQGRIVYDPAGNPTHAVGEIRDTTDRQESDAALRASEEKFAKAFQASPDLIAISDLGENGELIDVNDRFEVITGYPRAEALGRSMADLGLIDPALRSAQLAIAREQGSFRDFEFELRRPDGRAVTILISGEVIEIGGRQRLLTVGRDITFTKRAEEALQRSESRYRELVENANDIVFTVAPGGFCHPLNRAGEAVAGFAVGGADGVRLADLVVAEDADLARRQIERVLAGEDVPVFELETLSLDGARMRLEVNLRPIWKDGTVIAAQGIARDVTIRTRLEQQLRQAQRIDAVGRLAAGIAHDFNNLMTVILGNCEVGASSLEELDPMRHTLHEIRRAAERAATLTSQLLGFTRQQVFQPRILDANETIADIRRTLTRLIGENIQIQFVPEPALWHVRADPGQLQQVMVNLVMNARDAMPDGGQLTIRTGNRHVAVPYEDRGASVPAGDYAEIAVTDTGVGMGPEVLDRLFEPFFTTKELGKGTGLGLAMVYGIVKQSGGFVFAESELGVGSTFRILLARSDAPVTAVPASARPAELSSGLGTILLVEDEDEVRELIGGFLASQGYTILTANSGEDAVERLRDFAGAPTMLISDIVMPGMNGRVLSDHLRARYPLLKVLYVSGYTDDAQVANSPLPPGTFFLQKPFALSTLASKVREILDRR